MCFKPSTGVWVHVLNQSLLVIPRPQFSPHVRISGTVIPFHFIGAEDGDFVALQPNNCQNVHNISTGISHLAPTRLQDLSVETSTSMISSVDLRVCFATKESGADVSGDFTMLSEVQQFAPIDFNPKRTVTGATQHIDIAGANPVCMKS